MRIPGPGIVVGATIVVVLLVGGVVASVAWRSSVHDDPPSTTLAAPSVSVAPAARSVPVVRAVAALAVLHGWDVERAKAWAAGDAAELDALYVSGTPAGRRDVAMLRAWSARGLRVRDLRMQVVSVELRARTERRIVLVVTDRLAGARAVAVTGGGDARALPRDGASRRRIEFRLVGARWRVSAVTPLART